MSVRRLADQQPESFAFSPENLAWANKQIAKYPAGRQASAVIPLLWKAQEQNDYWLSKPAIEAIADMLGMPYIRVLEVATFYTMFNLAPVGKYFIQMCGTTPCMLRGSNEIKAVLEKRIGEQHHVTGDGKFSWAEVECLGACCNAPMVQINNDYYEDLTPEIFGAMLDDLAAGRPLKVGSQTGRVTSEPEFGKLTSLTDLYPNAPAGNDNAAALQAEVTDELVSDEHKPELLAAAREGGADDLKLIWGVGPKLEAMLHEMGVFHFDQIVNWTEMNLRWVDQNLKAFKGRAVRDKWIEQAKKLTTGWRPDSSVGDKPV